jgi:actin-like protein 6A
MAGYMSSTNQVFGGDEVGAVVVAMGGSTTKCGYGGEDVPRATFPSYVGMIDAASAPSAMDTDSTAKAAGSTAAPSRPVAAEIPLLVDQQLGLRRAGLKLRPVLRDGLVTDWEGVERLWQHALTGTLKVNPTEHPLLLSEPTHNTATNREKTIQLLFERHKPPAIYLAKDSVLTSFAFGRPTSVVVKSGGAYTSAVPVYEGVAMLKGAVRGLVSGDDLSDRLVSKLTSQGAVLRPRLTIDRRESPFGSGKYVVGDVDGSLLHPSFRAFWTRQLATDIKARCCRTSLFPHLIATSQDTASFELPDGQTVTLGADLVWGLAEQLFTKPGDTPGAPHTAGVKAPTMPAPPQETIADLVEQSVSNCDVDLKRELFANIIVSGGNTLWPGFSQRVGRVLGERIPQGVKLKLHAATTVSRLCVLAPLDADTLALLNPCVCATGCRAAVQHVDRRFYTVFFGHLSSVVDIKTRVLCADSFPL